MGKCVVHPMGQSAAMEEAVRKLMDGCVFVDGEEYRRCAEVELYTEFRAIVGRPNSPVDITRADMKNGKYIYSSPYSTPDRTKILGVNSNGDETKNAFLLILETGDFYEVAIPDSKNYNMEILYLDNECLLVKGSYSGSYLLDFRFTGNSLRLEHKLSVSNAELSDVYLGGTSNQLKCAVLNPGSDREPEAHFVTINKQTPRLTRFTYRKADHGLTVTTGDMASSGIDRNWSMGQGLTVDRDTILIMAEQGFSAGAPRATTKVLLYRYSENRLKAVLSPATVYYGNNGSYGYKKIIKTGPDRFLLCGWFVQQERYMSLCEVRVSGGTVEQLRILDEYGFLVTESISQDGDVLWVSDNNYRTLDDLGTLKENNRFICAKQNMDLTSGGELRYQYAYKAVPSSLAGGRLVFDGLNGALFLAKSKKLMTSLRKAL